MTRFQGGVADGRVLKLRRAPTYLRVVWSRWERDPAKALDALDLLTDSPRPGEDVFVYRRVGDVAQVHLRPGGWCVMATYEVVDPQPARDLVRRTEDWRAWVAAQREKDRDGEVRRSERPE